MDSLSWEEKYLRLRTEKDDIAKSKQSLLVNFLPILYSFHSLHFLIHHQDQDPHNNHQPPNITNHTSHRINRARQGDQADAHKVCKA